ncbi:MAG: 16S rRNA (cytosine(1402)-N(4))-methyltransferase RsmH [Betaproteobacteria bacterium]|nr:16S rRNA (cytosine(1402)-N(4))-methyltransferase RsmH [Betaproteobacteria bacterium]
MNGTNVALSAHPDSHRPVLLPEALDALAVKPDGIYVDGTFGRGGHSRAILARLGPAGRLIAIDRDPAALEAGRAIRDPRFTIVHARIGELARVLDAQGLERAHGMLFDLGVSSPQLDDAGRGFSFRSDGPLDMRMDPTHGVSAAEWLASAGEAQIREVIRDYGEERFAKQIAAAIVAARRLEPIRGTQQLASIVGHAVRTREPGQDPATRSFQAIRIFINQELEEIALMLPQAIERLAPQGRLAVISFHSLEDRIVKRVLALAARPQVPRDLPLRASELPAALLTLRGRVIRSGETEVEGNPRARSARMRIAERTAAAYDRTLFNRIGPDAWQS